MTKTIESAVAEAEAFDRTALFSPDIRLRSNISSILIESLSVRSTGGVCPGPLPTPTCRVPDPETKKQKQNK